jgi:hypothetical protein
VSKVLSKPSKKNIFLLFWIVPFSILVLSCYRGHGLSPDAPGIAGRITFIGSWPDSTQSVRVVALNKYPTGITNKDTLSLLFFNAYSKGELVFSNPIPMNVTSYDYRLECREGLWEWVVVVWFPNDFNGLKELGAYYADPMRKETPTPVKIISGLITTNIDIEADFSNIDRDVPFF